MSSRSTDSVLRVGVVGLGQRGMHLLERWSTGHGVRVVAACDTDPKARAVAVPVCRQVLEDAGSLLATDGVDAVAIATPTAERAAIARQALKADKSVLFVDPPVAADVEQAARLFETAESSRNGIAVWSPWSEEPDFQAATAAVATGLLGRLKFLRHEDWNAASEEDSNSSGLRNKIPRSLVYRFDQLLTLANAIPARVTVCSFQTALTAIVEFSDGPTATITLNRNSAVNLDSGWAIDATRGGFAAGRRWVRTDDGEIYDLPIEPSVSPSIEELLRTLVERQVPVEISIRAQRLVALVDASERSLCSKQWEDV